MASRRRGRQRHQGRGQRKQQEQKDEDSAEGDRIIAEFLANLADPLAWWWQDGYTADWEGEKSVSIQKADVIKVMYPPLVTDFTEKDALNIKDMYKPLTDFTEKDALKDSSEPCLRKLAELKGKKSVVIQKADVYLDEVGSGTGASEWSVHGISKADVELDETEEVQKSPSIIKDMFKPLTTDDALKDSSEPCLRKPADWEGKKSVSIQKADVSKVMYKPLVTDFTEKDALNIKDMYKPLTIDFTEKDALKDSSEPCLRKLAELEGKKFMVIQKADVNLDEVGSGTGATGLATLSRLAEQAGMHQAGTHDPDTLVEARFKFKALLFEALAAEAGLPAALASEWWAQVQQHEASAIAHGHGVGDPG